MAIVIVILCVLLGLAVQDPKAKGLFFAIAVIAFCAHRKRKKDKEEEEWRDYLASDKKEESQSRVSPNLPAANANKTVPRYQRITVNNFLKNPPDEYVAFDLETTGLNPLTDKIIEIGAVYVDHGQVIGSYSQLINPIVHIPFAASEVNHITDEMVKDCPTIESVLPEFRDFIEDVPVLAAHNAKFDAEFLMAAAKECGVDLNVRFFDTLALSREAWPNLKNHKLPTIAAKIKHPIDQAHRAYDDAAVLPDLINSAMRVIKRAEKKQLINQKMEAEHAASKETSFKAEG